MEKGKETGFKDKHGRAIHVDDIVQHRLGKFGKASGGPRNSRVIEFAGKFQLVAETQTDIRFGGSTVTEKTCENLLVLHCNHMPI